MKLRVFSLLVVAALASAPLWAQVGDAAAGQTKIVTCSACHGSDGKGILPLYPNLGGQGEAYLAKQILDIKNGVRAAPEMAAFTLTLTDQDILDIAAYYSQQPQQIAGAQPRVSEPYALDAEAFLALGEEIYRNGNMETGVPACTGCHSPSGMGNFLASYPMISGQQFEYLNKQLHDFRGNLRVNDGDTRMMRGTAARLTDLEIEAVANFIAGLN